MLLKRQDLLLVLRVLTLVLFLLQVSVTKLGGEELQIQPFFSVTGSGRCASHCFYQRVWTQIRSSDPAMVDLSIYSPGRSLEMEKRSKFCRAVARREACPFLQLNEHRLTLEGHWNLRQIPYCLQWDLVKAPHASPSTMTHRQLVSSINALEDSQNIPYTRELIEYVEALELRLAILCGNVWGDDVLDNPRGRVPHEEGYVLNGTADIELHVKVSCLLIWLRTGLSELRREGRCIRNSVVDEERVEKCMMCMIAQSDIISSEDIINEFSSNYASKKVRMSEGLLFRMETGVDDVTYLSIINKYRSKEQCDSISAASKQPLSMVGRYPTLDHAAFVVWFNTVADILFLKYLEQSWAMHSFSSNELLTQTAQLQRMSRASPIFVESHNEARIVYKSKIDIFGNHYKHWIQAFLMWLDLSKSLEIRRFRTNALEDLETSLMNTLVSRQPLLLWLGGNQPNVEPAASILIGSQIGLKKQTIFKK